MTKCRDGMCACCARASNTKQKQAGLCEYWEKSPLHLYTTYHYVPWLVLMHCALALLVTLLVIVLNSLNQTYVASQRRNWIHFLYPSDYSQFIGNPLSYPGDEYYLTRRDDLEESLAALFTGYNATSRSMTNMERYTPGAAGLNGRSPVPPPIVLMQYYNVPPDAPYGVAYQQFPLASASIQVVTKDGAAHAVANVSSMIHKLVALDVVLQFDTYNPKWPSVSSRLCFRWAVTVHYDLSQHAQVRVWTSDEFSACDKGWNKLSPLLLIAVAVVACSIVHQVMVAHKLSWAYKVAKLVLRLAAVAKQEAILRRAERKQARRHSHKQHIHRHAHSLGEEPQQRTAVSPSQRTRARHGPPGGAPGDRRQTYHSSSEIPALSHDDDDIVLRRRAHSAASVNSTASAPPKDPVMPDRFWSKFNIAVFEDVTYRDVLPLFSPWFAVTTTANILNAAYVISMVSYGQASLPDAVRILLAIGAALEWTALLQFLRHNSRYYVLILTLRRGMPSFLQFVAGVMPLFFAFCAFGTVVFGNTCHRFNGIMQTAITLFAISNGDVVRETYQMVLVNSGSWWLAALSQLYLYSFLCLFIYVVLMACIAIMEEAYLLSRPPADGAGREVDPHVCPPPANGASGVAAEADGDTSTSAEPSSPTPDTSAGRVEYRLPSRLRAALMVLDRAHITPHNAYEFAYSHVH